MRRLVLVCSVFAFVCSLGVAAAQTQSAAPAKRTASKKSAAAAAPPPETRPRYKRDDAPAPVVATAGKTVAGTKKRAVRKPADAQQPAAQADRATSRDVAACAQTSDHDAAIAGCTRIIEDGKQKPRARAAAYYNRGNAHAAKGDQGAAIADYDESIRLEPKNALALNNRGTAHSEKGDSDAALADFGAAIKFNPRFASAYFNRANAYAANGEADRAIADYTAAIRHNSRNVNAHIARGALYLAGGAPGKARDDMRRAAQLERRNAYAVLWQDIAERRAKHKGMLDGGRGLKNVEMNGWPAPLLHMFTGELKADGVLVAADNPDPALKEAHRCEAHFYSGQYALIQSNRDEAVRLFQAAAKECPRGFIEGIVAAAELKGLGEKL